MNKEEKKTYMEEWRKKNKEQIRESRRKYNQRIEIKARRNIGMKQRRKTDKVFRIRDTLRTSFNMAMKRYSTIGKIQSSSKYGMNIKEIIEHLKPFPKDIENYEIGHIIPVSWFDLNNPKEIKWAVEPTNHQWLTKEENKMKGNKYILIKC